MKIKLYLVSSLLAMVALAHGPHPFAQDAGTTITSQPARPSPAWLKSGVIYQILTGSFSPEGNLNGRYQSPG